MKVKKKAILILGAIVFLFAYIWSHSVDEELREKGKISIGKFDSIEEYRKRTYLGLSYYIGDNSKFFFNFGKEVGIGISKNF